MIMIGALEMTKEELTNKELEISEMDKTDLENFSIVVHNSMLDSFTKKVLLRAIETREDVLNSKKVDAMAVSSEIEED